MKMEGKRPRGRPKLRGKDTVRRDLKAWNIREEWATDRERWNGLCKTRYPTQGDVGERCDIMCNRTRSPSGMAKTIGVSSDVPLPKAAQTVATNHDSRIIIKDSFYEFDGRLHVEVDIPSRISTSSIRLFTPTVF